MSETKDVRDYSDIKLDLAAKGLLGSQMFPEIEEASRYANKMLNKIPCVQADIAFIRSSPKARIMRQPFFSVDKSAPVTIKFRRPVPYPVQAKVSDND